MRTATNSPKTKAASAVAAVPAQTPTVTLKWTPLTNPLNDISAGMWLMQDGTILSQVGTGQTLARLTPDAEGNYVTGTWSSAGSFLLDKLFYASAVLSDGRLIACGGEYSGPGLPQTETDFCEIYDPISQISTQINAPPGWTNIGDSPSAVLPDGSFLIGNTQGMGQQCGRLDPSSMTWTITHGDSDNEQGYVLLQNGDVLTTNVYNQTSRRYDPKAGTFGYDAPLPVMLGANSEIGPGMTLMDGRVIWFGASGHTCIYTAGKAGQNGTWVQGPDLPIMPANGDQLVASDVPAILEPNGRVLLVASGANTPTLFIEYDPVRNAFEFVSGAPSNAGDNEYVRMLLLPNGHGLVSLSTGAWYDVTFKLGSKAAWAPKITAFPTKVARGTSVQLSGTQLCGLSEVSTYGDDNQQAEHYPLVRFVNANGDVRYLRTHDVSTRSIAPKQASTVWVDIPSNLPRGVYNAYAVAMGIPSASVNVTVT